MPDKLFELLKQKRLQLAKRQGVEPYMIFSNAVLAATVVAKPKTLQELAAIKGWGERRVAQFGQEILDLINQGVMDRDRDVSGVLSVSDFLGVMNEALAAVGTVRVQGELSDIGFSNGMAFFDLKDTAGEGIAKCFLGSWKFAYYKHLLEAGFEVVITGRPSIYKSGFFRIVVEKIEPVGEGALKLAFEKLRKELELAGYFDADRKKPIPARIQRIGLITSETGAAITDFRRNLGEYGFDIRFCHVRVEGDQAAASILQALQYLNKTQRDLDAIVLIRGGGGLENLKTFNERAIADAILVSRLPVLVGIGHERDETIADYVADRRFSTPTAVAAFIRNQHEDWVRRVQELGSGLSLATEQLIGEQRRQLQDHTQRVESQFAQFLEQKRFVVRHGAERMQNALHQIFRRFRELEHRLQFALDQKIYDVSTARQHITAQATALEALNPLKVLERGYSMVTHAGHVLTDARKTSIGDQLTIHLAHGRIHTEVKKKEL